MTTKVLVTFKDSEAEGAAIFTKEEWQHRIDHLNSLGDPILNDVWVAGRQYYYNDVAHLLEHYKVEELTEDLSMSPEPGFFDPLRVVNWVDEEDLHQSDYYGSGDELESNDEDEEW